MTDFSFTTDEETYNILKRMFQTYEDLGAGHGTISKGLDATECFRIEFMQHQSESWFSNKPINKIYIRKTNSN
jgi:hypothetical protein